MRGAFVVQLRKAAESGQFEGSVEEVDSGKQAKFLSEKELLGFLRERFAQTGQTPKQKEETKGPNDDRP
jgi:hypothetical protein